jgi:hypothetical protein
MKEVGKSKHVNSPQQALAISYAIQRRGKATGGVVGYDDGGAVPQSHINEADDALTLNPQEKSLYQRHLRNLYGSGGVDNPDGTRSTLFQSVQEHNGKFYNIPTVWDGKIETQPWTNPNTGETMPMPNDTALKNVEKAGWDSFPSYDTPEEADARYNQMHDFMQKDTIDYQNHARGGVVRRSGGVVPHFDDGGAVQSVIQALSQGSQGVAAPAPPSSTTVPSATSSGPVTPSPPSSATVQPMSASGTPNTGVAAAPTMGAPGTPQTQPMASGVAQNTMPQVPVPQVQAANSPMAKTLMKRGGRLHRAVGGFDMAKGPHLQPSPLARRMDNRMTSGMMSGMMHGPILSAVPGRTDRHNVNVPSASYVIPADVVSAHGQGNTLAGMNVLSKLFKLGPHGSSMKMGRGPGAPQPPRAMAHSGGGKGGGSSIGSPTPVVVAGGEMIIPPENLMAVVHPNINHAHEIMDKWVLNERAKHIKTLKGLPGPAKD